jgi:hypothetical protein
MSASPPKADISGHSENVRKMPIADMSTSGISIVVATTVGGQSSGSTLMMEAP